METPLRRKTIVRRTLDEQRALVAYHGVPTSDEDVPHHPDDVELTWGEEVLESHTFMNVMAAIIVANGVIIGLETDIRDFKYWHYVEAIFLCIFLAEVVFKMWVESWRFFHPHEVDFLWNLFDLVIVGSGVCDFLTSCFGFTKIFGGFATIFRMARLLRVLRIIRLIKALKPLYLLAVGLIEACKAVIWVTLLMGTVLYVFSIVLVKTVGQVAPTDPHYDFLLMHFRNVPDSMITLFVLMSSPNLPMYQDEEGLLDSRPLFCLFLIMFICFGSFGMIAMLTGVINESMFQNNESRKHEKKLEHESMRLTLGRRAVELYETLPLDDEGRAKVDDLKTIAEAAAGLLDKSGISLPHGDIIRFLELMDENESGYIDLMGFVHAIERMAEGVSPLALIEVQHYSLLCNKKVTKQLNQMSDLEGKLEAQISKTEGEVHKILTVMTTEQNQHRCHLEKKMETQMRHLTEEVDRILQVITSEQNEHRGHFSQKMETQMRHITEEVDRILQVITSEQKEHRGHLETIKAQMSRTAGGDFVSTSVPAAPAMGDTTHDVQILPEIRKFDSTVLEKMELRMQRTAEEVDRILKVVTSSEFNVSRSVPAVRDPVRDVQTLSEIRRFHSTVLEKMESSMQRTKEEADRILKVMAGIETLVSKPAPAQRDSARDARVVSEIRRCESTVHEKMDSQMLRIAQEVDRIMKVVTGGEFKVSTSTPAVSVVGEPARDGLILSEIRKCESTVLAAVSRQLGPPASPMQSVIEKKLADFEQQLALKDCTDRSAQLAASSQLHEISGSLQKLLHEAGLQPKLDEICVFMQDINKKEDVLEKLRVDLARLMQESKNSMVLVVKSQDTLKENVDILTSKISMLEKDVDSVHMQVVSSVAELGGDIISSLSELLSASMRKGKQDPRMADKW